MNKELDNLVDYIKSTDSYKMCLKIKKQMNENDDLCNLINEIKVLQKKYVNSNYSLDIKEKLEKKEDELNNIPLYVIYNKYLNRVNEMIDYVRDELNDYFIDLLSF